MIATTFVQLFKDCGAAQDACDQSPGIDFVAQSIQYGAYSALNRATKTPKLYFRDTGLACYLTKYPTAETAMNGTIESVKCTVYLTLSIYELIYKITFLFYLPLNNHFRFHNRFVDSIRILTACLRHVRASATTAAYKSGNSFD